jgi:outer membrane lipoprotein-sorting protein
MVGDQEAHVIHYKLKDSYPPLRVSLWLDAKTNLPLRRVVVWGGVAGDHTTAETYSVLTLDAKVDAKRFELRKE